MAKITILDVTFDLDEKFKINVIEKASVDPTLVIDASSGELSSRIDEMIEDGKFVGNINNLNLEAISPLFTEQQAIQHVYEFISDYNHHVTTLVIDFGSYFIRKFSPELFSITREATGTIGVDDIVTQVIKFLLDTLVFDRVILFNLVPKVSNPNNVYPGNIDVLLKHHGVTRQSIRESVIDSTISDLAKQSHHDPSTPSIDPEHSIVQTESQQHHDLRKGLVVIGFSIINKIPADITNDFRSLLVAIDENDLKKSFVIYEKIVETTIDNTTPPSAAFIKAFLFLLHECLIQSDLDAHASSIETNSDKKEGDPEPLDIDDALIIPPDEISRVKKKQVQKGGAIGWIPW